MNLMAEWLRNPGRASVDALHACPAHGMKGDDHARERTHLATMELIRGARAAWHTPGLAGPDRTDRGIQEHAYRSMPDRTN
jgi:hypothetical protein